MKDFYERYWQERVKKSGTGISGVAEPKLKLVYVTNARVPSEKAHPYQIMKMCEAFKQHGVDVRLIIPWRVQTPEMRAVRNIWEYYGISQKFNIRKIPCIDFLWITYYLHLPPWLELAIWRLLSVSFAAFATLYLVFDRADIYYSRDVLTLGFLSFFKKNLYLERHQKAKLVRLARLLFNRINGLIVITNYLKDFFTKLGVPEGKILVAPDGVDLGMFGTSLSKDEAREQLGIPSDEKVVCYTGHLYSWKGAHVLARSAKYLKEAKVYFVGGTPDDIQNFRKFIRENDLSNVVIVGHVPPSDVPKYLAASDVTVLPNIQEGLSYATSPLKLFEYMASRRPIVASDLPVIREVLNQGNAILVEPGNPEALAGEISTVLDDEDLADRIVEKAYREVHQYTWLTRANRILRFVKKRSLIK